MFSMTGCIHHSVNRRDTFKGLNAHTICKCPLYLDAAQVDKDVYIFTERIMHSVRLQRCSFSW